MSEDVIHSVDITDRDVLRSRSTSELSITEEQTKRRFVLFVFNYFFIVSLCVIFRSGSSMHPGLSVSHDSVFHSPNSGSDMDLDRAQSSSSLCITQPQMRLQVRLFSF